MQKENLAVRPWVRGCPTGLPLLPCLLPMPPSPAPRPFYANVFVFRFQFICVPNDMIQISNKLIKGSGCILLSANIEYLPKNLITLNDNHLEKVDKLLGKILKHEDVVKTYDNVENYPSETYKIFIICK